MRCNINTAFKVLRPYTPSAIPQLKSIELSFDCATFTISPLDPRLNGDIPICLPMSSMIAWIPVQLTSGSGGSSGLPRKTEPALLNQLLPLRGWKCHHSPLTVGRIPYLLAIAVTSSVVIPRLTIRRSTAYENPSGCS